MESSSCLRCLPCISQRGMVRRMYAHLFIVLVTGLGLQAGDGSKTPQQGEALYLEHCSVCHQPDGSGMGFEVPMLTGSPRLGGPKEDLISFVLTGTAEQENLVTDFLITMPAFNQLSDAEMAALLTYVRNAFGEAGPVRTEDVIAVRAQKGLPSEPEE